LRLATTHLNRRNPGGRMKIHRRRRGRRDRIAHRQRRRLRTLRLSAEGNRIRDPVLLLYRIADQHVGPIRQDFPRNRSHLGSFRGRQGAEVADRSRCHPVAREIQTLDLTGKRLLLDIHAVCRSKSARQIRRCVDSRETLLYYGRRDAQDIRESMCPVEQLL
jgi:hypothetical protein